MLLFGQIPSLINLVKHCMKSRRKFLFGFIGAVPITTMAGALAARVTPSEIEGPFYPVYPQKDKDFDLTRIEGRSQGAAGKYINIKGVVRNSNGDPIEGASVDIWQANAAGRYRHPHDRNPAALDPNFQGWAIVQSGHQGQFNFKTVMPGAYPASATWTRPPHIHFKVSKLGYAELTTQMYFPGHPLNKLDRLLQGKNESERELMIAQKLVDESDTYSYTIFLQEI